MHNKRLTSKDRRAQIADIAAELFAHKGFSGTTTREIAKKAKVNEALLFRHFPTKEALYTEIINQKIHIKPEMFNEAAVKAGDDAEVFKTVARFMINQSEEDSTFIRILFFSALEDHRLSSMFFKERTFVLFDFLCNYIERRIKTKVFKNIKPMIAVRAFMGMIFHFIIVEKLFKVPSKWNTPTEETIDQFVEIFLKGILKK